MTEKTTGRPIEYPSSNDTIQAILDTRAEVLAAFKNILIEKARGMIKLIPRDINVWAFNEFSGEEGLANWLVSNKKTLSSDTGLPIVIATEGEEAAQSGFTDKESTIAKFEALKQAWNGLIDLEILNHESTQNIAVIFKFPGA